MPHGHPQVEQDLVGELQPAVACRPVELHPVLVADYQTAVRFRMESSSDLGPRGLRNLACDSSPHRIRHPALAVEQGAHGMRHAAGESCGDVHAAQYAQPGRRVQPGLQDSARKHCGPPGSVPEGRRAEKENGATESYMVPHAKQTAPARGRGGSGAGDPVRCDRAGFPRVASLRRA